jgi:hypothetical protein
MTALAQAAQASGTPPSAGDLLALLITAEGLLFAALAIGVTIQSGTQERFLPKLIAKGGFAGLIFAVIFVVAVGAAASWYDVFGDDFMHSPARALAQSVALAVVIAAQPLMGFAVWRGSAR